MSVCMRACMCVRVCVCVCVCVCVFVVDGVGTVSEHDSSVFPSQALSSSNNKIAFLKDLWTHWVRAVTC